ncbi:MAG: TFIIB-type zinc ribbon-containing protein [Acidobacteria bacterium]|nr:TFIIB-type zinc ribbon-containing protein [Acidobacteriota bacterium]MCA1638155.1 TFIIB-type zinc ribbon-containing protein [Acidobacteriota bacterium]
MKKAPEINRENINRFLCPSCGANMVFNPQNGQLTCSYCGYAQAIQAVGTVEEKSYEEFLRPEAMQLQPMAINAMQVGCASCGAIVNFTPPETAQECDFCGAKIVALPKAADPLIAPEGVLPFRVTTPQANAALKGWISSRWFAPSKLKDFARPDKISSIYIPYWTYDAFSRPDYDGERGEHYYETVYYEENGEQKSRQVRHTNWYSASGAVGRQFDDVSVPATTSLPQNYLNALEPWDFAELKSYEPAFLSGHKAQTYQIALPQGFQRFKEIASGVILSDVCRDIGGDEQRVHNVSTYFSDITFKHLLLPVYAGAYQFSGKTFQIVVNGRTGEVQGDRPYSWLKIAAFVFVLIVLIVILASVLR